MRRKLRVLALQRESHVAPGVPSLSVAARVTEVLDYLQSREQIEYTSIPENDPAAANGVAWADVLMLSKHSSSSALACARQARKLGKRAIYDFDDWIFSFPGYSGGKHTNDKTAVIQDILSQCHAITVANPRLQQKLAPLVPGTLLVPNGMWVEKYAPHGLPAQQERGTDGNRIVFTNADFLKMEQSKELLLTALQVFFIRHPQFVLDFYGDPFPEIVSLPFLHFTNRVPYEQYMKLLISGRYLLSITPLGAGEDPAAAEFNACKNPFKYLNYGTAGIPGIYSASPIYQDCIQSGYTGIIIKNTLSDWVEALEAVAFDKDLQNTIRQAAFHDIQEKHHVKYSAKALLDVI